MSATVSASLQERVRRGPDSPGSLFFLLRTGWLRCAESRLFAYTFFAAVYILPNVVLAREKLIWDDEFFTVYLSKIATWSELWRALSTGADQHPPTFYYLTHLIFTLAGAGQLTLRLTPLVGFGLCCVCLYEIARRLIGWRWALPAMLAPTTAPVLYYATEARGYGLELGFVTFSFLMWLLASEGKKRAWTVPAMGVALCLAVASHYCAIFFVLPLASGEFVRAWRRRTIDLPVCCALSAAFAPLFVFAPIIFRAKMYSTHFWAVPFWGSMLEWYPSMIGRMPLIFLAAVGLIFAMRTPAREDSYDSWPTIPLPVVVAITTIALIPVVGDLSAELITRAFTGRYFISALPGVVLLMVWGLKRLIRNDATGPALASALCLVLFAQQWRDLHKAHVTGLQELRSVATLLRHSGNAPVVLSDVTIMYQLSFYGRRDLASRLVYTADPHLSVKYIGHDTIDRGLLDLAPWFPLQIVRWHDWWLTHSYSLVYGYIGSWSWSTFALTDIGRSELLARDLDHLLLGVTRTKLPKDDRTSSDPSGKPRLYDRLPSGGPPLCKTYFPKAACLIVDDPSFTAPTISYTDLLPQH